MDNKSFYFLAPCKDSYSSYSPLFSSIGLQAYSDIDGVGEFYFHYNRGTRSIFDLTLSFNANLNEEKSDITCLVFGNDDAFLSFYENDAFVFETNKLDKIELFKKIGDTSGEPWEECRDNSSFVLRGYSDNPDGRDPDLKTGFCIGVKVITGKLENKTVYSDNGRIMIAIAFEALEFNTDSVFSKLSSAPSGVKKAKEITQKWVKKYTESYNIPAGDENECNMISRAVQGLLFNTVRAQGKLKNHLSAFPSRGGYPTHYIWDTYFQNLAYIEMSPYLAKDFLLQIADNMRSDGKCPQFMCSTWDRPHEAQPALLGWAVMNYISETGDNSFAEKIFPILEKNNNWWLSQRMTKHGVVFCPNGLETGQDNSPRFDKGATLAADMNSYLLKQLYVTAQVASMLGFENKKEKWLKVAKKLSDAMMNTLYDSNDNIFYDVLEETNEKIKIVSPSALLPVWAGVELSEEKCRDMIKKYLLSPDYMYGDIPFPCVAFNEESFEEGNWWRGPSWMSISYLTLESLKIHGFEKEYLECAKKMRDAIYNDRDMHELFNSKTGEGLGFIQQGWTCAVFIKLCKILNT